MSFVPNITLEPKSVVVIDNFYTAPDAVRKFALEQEFRTDERGYKGFRSATFPWANVRMRFEDHLNTRILDWDVGYNGCFQLTKGGDPLVYHSDHQRWAAGIYLTPDAPFDSGLSLFASKKTGGRTVEESALIALRQGRSADASTIERDMYVDNLLDRSKWREVDRIGNVYNRAVIWDARMVHAASGYFGVDPPNCRLIQLFFFNSER